MKCVIHHHNSSDDDVEVIYVFYYRLYNKKKTISYIYNNLAIYRIKYKILNANIKKAIEGRNYKYE